MDYPHAVPAPNTSRAGGGSKKGEKRRKKTSSATRCNGVLDALPPPLAGWERAERRSASVMYDPVV